MRFRKEDDEIEIAPKARGGAASLGHLHGLWVDEIRGSMMCIDASSDSPRTVYCSGGDHELTGVYERWRFDGLQYIGEFRWLERPIAGYVVLQPEGSDILVGGWWYDRDVPPRQVARLPFVPGVHPCRWVRKPELWWWPEWAAAGLGLEGPVTSASLRPKNTAERRYGERVALWIGPRVGLDRWAARVRHHGWWLIHNLVAHPLLAFARGRRAVAFHDWTSRRLNLETSKRTPSPLPEVQRPLWWFVHNVVAHAAMAIAPCTTTFRWHDTTARRMQVRGWV